MKKRIILITIIGLFLLMLPLIANAEVVNSGTWRNLSWTLDSNGLLTISGIGEMDNYDNGYEYETSEGWHCNNINYTVKTVIICDGVTSIGDYAFANFERLISITIPEGITSIGKQAFWNCMCLKSITIPDGVTRIGSGAFYNCPITNITLPDSVTCIDGAFGDSGLANINIPDSITSIGGSTFSYCSNLTNITLPNGLTSIGDYAFSYSGLTSITIPNSVTSIGNYAFAYCDNLTRLAIPDSVHIFGNNIITNDIINEELVVYCNQFSDADYWATAAGCNVVFLDNMNMDDIRTIALPDDFKMLVGEITTLKPFIFPLLDNPSYIWGSSNPSIISVDNGIITAHNPGTAKITLTIGAVSESVNITAYRLADSYIISPSELWIVAKEHVQLLLSDIKPIGADPDVTWSSSDSAYATVDSTGLVTTKKPSDEVIIISADSENGIHRECLLHICYPVTAIELESSTDEMIPDSYLQLNAHVTMRTQSCENHLVTFTSSNPEIATVDEMGLIHAIKPGTVTVTVESASGIIADKTITVLDICEVIDGEFIDHVWSDIEYVWSDDNTSVTATRVCQRHVEHVQTETVSVLSEETKAATCTEMGETTYTSTEFENEVFETQTKALTDIPALGHDLIHHDAKAATCTEIGWDEYDACTRCDYSTYEEIPATGHTEVTDAAVPATCTETGLTEGKHCSVCGEVLVAQEIVPAEGHILTVHEENGIEVYWECSECGKLFSDAEGIVAIIASGECGNGVFWTLNTEGLLTISGNGKITRSPWNDCSDFVKNVFIHDGITNVPGFYNFKNLTGITIPDTVTEITSFYMCSSLTSIEIPDSATTLDSWTMFAECTSLERVKLPANIVQIPFRAFENCANLSDIIIPDSVTSISGYAFAGCRSLTSITIPDNVRYIGQCAFSGCTGLTSLELPDSVTSIGYCAFASCTRLTSINLPDKAILDHSVFSGCTSLKNITLPKASQKLSLTFNNCRALETIIIQGPVTIETTNDPFAGCNELKEIYIPVCNTAAIQWITDYYWDISLNITPHVLSKVERIDPTYYAAGTEEYWSCNICHKLFSDENGENEITGPTIIPMKDLNELDVLYLPENLKSIEEEAFANLSCQAIIIPNGCTTIGERAFAGCSNLIYVKIPASVTSYPASAFEGCNENLFIDWEEH